MKFCYVLVRRCVPALASLLLVLGVPLASAHHPLSAKFDMTSSRELTGIVTYVDWRNPHAHIYLNVASAGKTENWAVELESPILLKAGGWHVDSLQPGDAIHVSGPVARDGSRQLWGDVVTATGTGHRLFTVADLRPPAPLDPRPAPRWPDGHVALGGIPGGSGGYWSFPSEPALVEEGAAVAFNDEGLLLNLADASAVAPLQDWALALYRFRQQRQLRDDPMFLNCKPPGGPRQYQSNLGFQLIEDLEKQRVFVLMGSGNHNYRTIYLDGREQQGQVRGDDDNPLYYGRSVGHWEGDTLVASTTDFNEDFWFSNGGLPHTSRLVLTERFSRPDMETLRYEVTVDDPGAYTRPWTAGWTLQWVGGEELPVHFCQNNRQ
ncbi:MAG: DUF6152 family protein [Pseudomonadales bacterium]|nr:DUF6152 family protein [Pseudomonadales bacterium]